MIVIVALDDRNGMLFHQRRQSQDRVLRQWILALAGSAPLWMNGYSASLFAGAKIQVDERFLEKARTGDYCWVENLRLRPWESRIEQLICFRWNRRYPGDFFLDLPLEEWILTETESCPGYSHEMITKEVYQR